MTKIKRKLMRPLFLWGILFIVCHLSCTPPDKTYFPGETWETSTPEKQGMDSRLLTEMLRLIDTQRYPIDSICIVKNGYIVLDVHLYPYLPGTPREIQSCAKSIVSAAVGICIDKGMIAGVDEKVLDFFPGIASDGKARGKKELTIKHLLTMTPGIDTKDSYLYRWHGIKEIWNKRNWEHHILSLLQKYPPGEKFDYSNFSTFLLSAIIREASGMSLEDYVNEYLFKPIGIKAHPWEKNRDGNAVGWSGISLPHYDMAKIGYVYLNKGKWKSTRVLPEAWIAASTRQQVRAGTLSDGYGFHWWTSDKGYYMAIGYEGQYIIVVPDKNMVVVFTSTLPERLCNVPERLLNKYIIPAVVSDLPLEKNPSDVKNLVQTIITLQEYDPGPTKIPGTPDFEEILSSADYLLKEYNYDSHCMYIRDQLCFCFWISTDKLDVSWAAEPDPVDRAKEVSRTAFALGAGISSRLSAEIKELHLYFDAINPMIVDTSYNAWYIDIISLDAFPEHGELQGRQLLDGVEEKGSEFVYRRRLPPREEHLNASGCQWSSIRKEIGSILKEDESDGKFLFLNRAAYPLIQQRHFIIQVYWDMFHLPDNKESPYDRIENLIKALRCLQPLPHRLEVYITTPRGRLFQFSTIEGTLFHERDLKYRINLETTGKQRQADSKD